MTGRNRLAITLLLPFLLAIGAMARNFNIENKCTYSVWLGTIPSMDLIIFEIGPGEELLTKADDGWRGRIWLRTRCSGDPAGALGQTFTCLTGDCHSGVESCDGRKAHAPVTLLDFINFSGNDSLYFYDVNVQHGFNVPAAITPVSGGCPVASCPGDIDGACPAHLQVVDEKGLVIACQSDCDKDQDDQSCCINDYGSREKCRPSASQQLFKTLCPSALTWTFDEAAVFSCANTDFNITLCPP